jgi:arsenite methyltransferase
MKGSILRCFYEEIIAKEQTPRVPEQGLVMDDLEEVINYTRAARASQGESIASNLFNLSHICEVIKDGDTVLDLACGPAILLSQAAILNPNVKFIGLDMSVNMLDQAQIFIEEKRINNMSLKVGDISDLSFLADDSCDAVVSTFSFHHLPEEKILQKTFQEVARVLKPGGGVYFMDFGRLKSDQAMQQMAYRREDAQTSVNTANYLSSLRAAFSLDEYKEFIKILGGDLQLYSTFIAPFIVVVKSEARQTRPQDFRRIFREKYKSLEKYQKDDINNLMLALKLNGLASSFLK